MITASTRTPLPSGKAAHQGDPGQAEYTCPMHPEVRQMGPGNCPKCGMALEPVLATAEPGESPELRDMTRRFWIGTALTAPVFALEMGGHLVDLSHLVGQRQSNWIQLVLATPVVLWAGWPFFVRGVASVKNRSLNMFSLIALGTGAAWIYSMVGTFARGCSRPSCDGGRRGAGLLRGRGRHHRAGAAGPGAGAAGAREDVGGHQGAAGAGAENGRRVQRRRQR